MAEMQSRWSCEIFKGRLSLPPPSSMLAQMQSDAAAVRKRFYGSARHSVQRDTFPYNDSLAAAMGCKPPLLSMDFRLMCRLWLGTVERTRACGNGVRPPLTPSQATPSQWRLRGPHAWSGAGDL
jgi:hypothetical protein